MARKLATTHRPDLDELTDFLRPRHRALLVTNRQDGSPQLSPVTCGVDHEGRVVVSTYPERAKARNASRDPRVSVCVLSDDWDGPYVQVDGEAEVLHMPAALEPLVEYFRVISGEHPDWDEYREAMRQQGKAPDPDHPAALGAHRHRGIPAAPGRGVRRPGVSLGPRPAGPRPRAS